MDASLRPARVAAPRRVAAADAPGTAPRRAALTLLHAVMVLGRPLDLALGGALGSLPPRDRGLAHAIALAALRSLPAIDRAIDGATATPLPPDSRARGALRIALAQLWTLGTPPHAVIATVLPLVEGGPRRLVHGVLSRLLREQPAPPAPQLPEPWAERWTVAYGAEAAERIAAVLGVEPPLDLTLRDPAATAHWAERLGGASLMAGHVRLKRAGDVTALPGFAEGAWWVQDLAASLPARMLGAGPGRALDLCAAPGGKTLQLAAAGWDVTALDLSERRLGMLRENVARTGLAADVVCADALAWTPDAPFDAILLDAPCSATGIARRHPDVLHLKASRELAPLLALQAALGERAAAWLKPGGRLVYGVCSLEPEEGEAQARRLGERLAGDPIGAGDLPPGLAPGVEGWLRVRSDMIDGGVDGFFVARFRG